MNVTIYTTKTCTRCPSLRAALDAKGIDYNEMDMGSAEGMTELRVAGVFTLSAPVLRVDDRFYTTTDLFDSTGALVPLEMIVR